MNLASPQFPGRSAGKVLALAVAGFLGLGTLSSAPSAAENPFATLVGAWSGNGTVTYASGTKERLRCKVSYDQNAPDAITQQLRCAADSYKFQINAYYKHTDTTLTGHWDELVLQVSGSISGSVAPSGKINGALHGPGFQAAVVVDTKGDEQKVSISAENQEIRQVDVSVHRN